MREERPNTKIRDYIFSRLDEYIPESSTTYNRYQMYEKVVGVVRIRANAEHHIIKKPNQILTEEEYEIMVHYVNEILPERNVL